MRRIFGLAAAFVVTLGLASAPARAEYPYTAAEPNDWFFFSVEGAYVLSGGTSSQFTPGIPVSVIPGSSWRGGAKAGVRINNQFDVALGAAGTFFPVKNTTIGADTVQDYGFYFTADLEAGYRMMVEQTELRLVGGLRGLWYHQNTDLTGTDPGAPSYLVMGTWGVGPRVGVEATHKLGDSGFSLFGDVSASALFGQLKQVGTYQTVVTGARFNTMLNAEATAGVSMEVMPGVELAAGYRAELLGNADFAFKSTNAGGPGTGSSSRLFHGPFMKLSGAL